MYYFGTNVDNRFTVPDLWPRPEQTHKIPMEREEMLQELERLRHRRLALRERRLERERAEREMEEGEGGQRRGVGADGGGG